VTSPRCCQDLTHGPLPARPFGRAIVTLGEEVIERAVLECAACDRTWSASLLGAEEGVDGRYAYELAPLPDAIFEDILMLFDDQQPEWPIFRPGIHGTTEMRHAIEDRVDELYAESGLPTLLLVLDDQLAVHAAKELDEAPADEETWRGLLRR
jgi:hypothetical protein